MHAWSNFFNALRGLIICCLYTTCALGYFAMLCIGFRTCARLLKTPAHLKHMAMKKEACSQTVPRAWDCLCLRILK